MFIFFTIVIKFWFNEWLVTWGSHLYNICFFRIYGSLSSLLRVWYFYQYPWHLRRLCVTFHTRGQSLPPGCFGPIRIHCILHNKWDSILPTSSGPLRLPWDSLPVLFRVFYCSVIGTSRFPTAQTALLCGVLSAWSSLCLMSPGQTCTPPHPQPGQCPVCIWLKYPSGLFSTVEFWNVLHPFSAHTRVYFTWLWLVVILLFHVRLCCGHSSPWEITLLLAEALGGIPWCEPPGGWFQHFVIRSQAVF